jgi:hypothetical protein
MGDGRSSFVDYLISVIDNYLQAQIATLVSADRQLSILDFEVFGMSPFQRGI